MSTAKLRPHVVAARQRLADGHEELRLRHQAGGRGAEVCRAATDLRDEVVLELYRHALAALGDEGSLVGGRIALVAHGGYGRRDVAPFSDVDLMILYPPDAADGVEAIIQRLLADVFDAGLVFGNSVRTIEEACKLATEDATICSSLVESRLLGGSEELFDRFVREFQIRVRRRGPAMVAAIEQARQEERLKFGETVFLLEPNVKRSQGGLRDLQLLRWVGAVRYGAREPQQLCEEEVLLPDDLERIEQANEFLLWLRNEIHFFANKPGDVLSRSEQVRIAGVRGYQDAPGLLAAEQFMREYFRHTGHVSHLATRLLAKARSAPRLKAIWANVAGRRVPGGVLVGPTEIVATRRALSKLGGDLAATLELIHLANLYDKQLSVETWEAIHHSLVHLPEQVPADAKKKFLAILEYPGRLGELLRGMHEIGLLERLIPALSHTRGLLQFNQYHKYTVDEHCLRAVDWAVRFVEDQGPFGREYQAVSRKHVLHMALLLHDLGKGYLEDHCEVGRRIAEETCAQLGMEPADAEAVQFLVHRHLLMNHLAFRRDTSEEGLIVRFAVDVGSPELLRMLYLFTAADLGAVGPDTWTSWKGEILTDLYHRAMQHLAGERPGAREEYLAARRRAVADALGPDGEHPAIVRELQSLTASYLTTTEPSQIADDLRLLAALGPAEMKAEARYQPETKTVQFTVGTSEDAAPGIFYRLTGALTSQGLEILSAQINTLSDGKVLDRFWVYDPDYAGQPPSDRLDQIRRALADSLSNGGKPPNFRRVWGLSAAPRPTMTAQSRVHIDNKTSDRYTIIDVFTFDRRGLLYNITRALFELGFSVWRAKIGTYLEQVVDVFYVTDQAGRKLESPEVLQKARQRLLEVAEGAAEP